MLEAIRTTLDGLSEDEKRHYVQKDGKFFLDVGATDGFSLENVTGLKKTVETLRASERKLKTDFERLTESFKDIDPESAREALGKVDEMKNWDKDKKVKETIDANKKELIKQHEQKVVEFQTKISAVTGQLQEAIVTTRIIEALQQEKGNVELLLPHVKRFVHMKEGSDGKFYPEVVGDTGDPRVGDAAGNPMTVLQRVQEMKSQKTFAPAFEGVQSTGGGSTGSERSGTQNSQTGGGVIQATNNQVQVSNLADVASGKTRVDMK